MSIITEVDLGQELSPEEIEEAEQIEPKKIDTVNSPFSFLMANLLQGGGRQGRGGGGSRETPGIVNGRLCGQNFDEIRQKCLQSGQLFTDPEFPPDQNSLYFSQSAPYSFEWKRPHELSQDPQIFEGGSSRFDINQGELGDCWLLAALANLTQNKKLLYRVVPLDQSFSEEYCGAFHFKFWQYGTWVDVVVDDFLPTRSGELMFMHSKSPNEFWTALLEKAYAKLYGSYEALKGGTTCEAMVDFTGGCSELYQLKESDCPKDLINIMLKAFQRCSLKGCSLEPDPRVLEAKTSVGLIRGHAYSITKVVKAKIQTPKATGQIPLIRIRNPWGNEAEWNGPWSDGSPEWQYISDDEKAALGLDFSSDGEFWMSYKDFMKYFDQLEICNLTPDALEGQDSDTKLKWEVASFQGSWTAGSTAGGCRNYLNTFAMNPQYRISVVDPDDGDDDNLCTVIISLMQKGRRALMDEGLDTLTIGFGLYHLRDPSSAPHPLDTDFFKYNKSVGRSKAFINLREVSVRFRLPPGSYVIVPSTFKPNEEGDFIIRIFTEKGSHAEEG